MQRSNTIWGAVLIIVGCLFLINIIFHVSIFSMDYLWPLFVLIPGLSFEFSYFVSRRAPGLLVPGGILTTIGFLFFFEVFTNWIFAAYTWPVYILAVAIGLFQLYLFTGRHKGLLIPVGILTTIGTVALVFTVFGGLVSAFSSNIILSIILVLVGIFILFRNRAV